MAITIPAITTRIASMDEFVDYVSSDVDLNDLDSVAAAAPMLAALANDRELVVRELNRLVEAQFRSTQLTSAQSLYLGRGKNFYVRANVWPSAADVASGRLYQDQFSYDIAHDHNYDFLTVNHFGPGYVTEIYEYDPAKLAGYPGEPVALEFLEKSLFASGSAMLYRSGRDVHVQYPPEDLSITLNLMLSVSSTGRRDQYYFDLAEKKLAAFTPEQDSSRRVAIVSMGGHVGDDETRSLLTDLSRRHPCQRTRLSAFEALVRLTPADAVAIWEQACRDPEPLVVRESTMKISLLAG